MKLAVIWAVQLVVGLAARRQRGWRGRKGQPPARREASGEAGGLRSFDIPRNATEFFFSFQSSRNGAYGVCRLQHLDNHTHTGVRVLYNT